MTRRTTIGEGAETGRPAELVKRKFVATPPNLLGRPRDVRHGSDIRHTRSGARQEFRVHTERVLTVIPES